MADETPETPTPPRKWRKGDLDTLTDVKRALARCCRALAKSAKDPGAAGAMPVDHARALVYAYSKLAELIRVGDADEVMARLAQLEARQARMDEENRVQ